MRIVIRSPRESSYIQALLCALGFALCYYFTPAANRNVYLMFTVVEILSLISAAFVSLTTDEKGNRFWFVLSID